MGFISLNFILVAINSSVHHLHPRQLKAPVEGLRVVVVNILILRTILMEFIEIKHIKPILYPIVTPHIHGLNSFDVEVELWWG